MAETSSNWIGLILFVCFLFWINADSIVDTKLGKVRGTLLTSDNGKLFHAFRGIPYAKPPVKQLRFMPPVPVENWQNTLDATENGHACIQADIFRNKLITGDEDCLYLNVYTKQLTKSSLWPVMVFIHGGGQNTGEGSSHLYGPQRLLDKDIVLVTFNYRLSALGYLSTEDAESPGNYGLLDQVEVLKWIQQHIKNFGGDPESVTIFGESAGGSAVIFHLMSPLSKGLFHGAIAQSGSAANLWATQRKPMRNARLLAKALNCTTDNSKNLVNCLRKRAALDVMMQSSLLNFSNTMHLQYVPVIDKGFGTSAEFLSEHPKSLLAKHQINKVPVIIGNVKDEGYSFLQTFTKNVGGPENLQKADFIKMLSEFNNLYENDYTEKFAAEHLINADLSDPRQKIQLFSDMLGDLVINSGIDFTVNAIAASGVPTYAYRLTYSGENSIGSKLSSLLQEDYSKTLNLVSHLDDLQYLFRLGYFPNDLNGKDKQMAETILTLWTNFAENKIPSLNVDNVDSETFQWNPVEPNQHTQYLNIGNELRMEKGILSSRPDLWKEYQAKNEL